MTMRNKKPGFVWALILCLYIASAGLFLMVIPQPREALQYMVAGAFATGVSLALAFVLYVLGGIDPELIVRTVRRSAQSS